MIELLKTKGPRFFLKRSTDKISNLILSLKQEKEDKIRQTYGNQYDKIKFITPVYDASKIRYNLFDNDKILNFADNILSHKFSMLGSGLQEVSHNLEFNGFENIKFSNSFEYSDNLDLLKKSHTNSNYSYAEKILLKINPGYIPIDWQRDFRSGFRWSAKTHFSKIRYGNSDGPEVKIPWELGRFNHQIILFYAWKISGDQKYKDEFQNQIYDYIAFNPPRFGVQWAMPMDSALRAVNIISVYSLFITSGAEFEDFFCVTLLNFLYDHFIHLMNNLEWSSGMRANHYLANITGLIYLTAFLPINDKTAFGFCFALNELANETFYQFNDDGSNFEASLPYHNFAAEMLFQTFVMLKQTDVYKILEIEKKFSYSSSENFRLHDDILAKIKSGFNEFNFVEGRIEFSDRFQNKIKNIADFTINIIPKTNQDFQIGDNDNGYFFRFIPFINEDFSIQSNIRTELKKIASYISGNQPATGGNFYKDFGLYLFRNDNYEICIRCGSVGQKGKGGHAHNDQLSFELLSGNDLLICDAGTYIYTAMPQLRNEFRSTKSHNTLIIDGKEQNPLPDGRAGNLFWLPDICKARLIQYNTESFTGVHYGYEKPHSREMNFSEKSISGKDICEISGIKKIHFHLTQQSVILSQQNNSINLKSGSKFFSIKSDVGTVKTEKYYYSPSYGVKYSALMIVIEFLENEICWEISLEI